MKDYTVENIRNVCLMSHGGAGKTALAEAMLFNAGALDRLGSVAEGTACLDYDPEEIKRQTSISTAIGACEYKGKKINIIDTPGFFDFVGEVKQGVRVADSVIILVSAKSGVAVGTKKSWEYAQERNLPTLFFLNKIDDENANFKNVYNQLKEEFGKKVAAFQIPIIEEDKYVGYVDVLTQKGYKFEGAGMNEVPIPDDIQDRVDEALNQIKEAIAESDEVLMDKFFSGEEYTHEEFMRGIKAAIDSVDIMPVCSGAPAKNHSVDWFMDLIAEYLPHPDESPAEKAIAENGDVVEILPVESDPFSALVFKTIADPFVGKISLFKVYSGSVKNDDMVYNMRTGKTEKISSMFFMLGKKNIPTNKISAGDIGAVAKLQDTKTNDTLCSSSKKITLEKIEFPKPALALAIEPKAKGDEEKISSGLKKLKEEDPTFDVSINTETHQTLLSGIGEQHLDVIVSKLKQKFGTDVILIDPKIPFREAIKKKVKVEGKHKKQSGGHGQFGHVWVEFEPGTTEELTFEEKIFGGSVPKQYIPAVEKGLQEAIFHGVLAGYPVVNLKATLVDGSYHAVDSSEMAFKIAANEAYKKGMTEGGSVLLEPIMIVNVFVKSDKMGDVIGDLNKRRGRILGMEPIGKGMEQVTAEVPMSEMFKYATDLRSMTRGEGYFTEEFERYEEAPMNVSQKVIEEAKANGDI